MYKLKNAKSLIDLNIYTFLGHDIQTIYMVLNLLKTIMNYSIKLNFCVITYSIFLKYNYY